MIRITRIKNRLVKGGFYFFREEDAVLRIFG